MKNNTSKIHNNAEKRRLSFNITYEDLPNNYDNFVNSELNKISFETIHNDSPEMLEMLLNLHAKHPAIPEVIERLAAYYDLRGNTEKADEFLKILTYSCPDYFFGYYIRAMKALKENKPEEVPVIFKNCFNIKDFFPKRNDFHVSEVASFSYVMGLYYCAIDNIEAAQINYDFLTHTISKKDEKAQHLKANIELTKTLNEMLSNKMNANEVLSALNQKNEVPISAILTALERSEEVTPTLLDFLEYILNNFQTADVTERSDIITTLFILAKLKEQKAFPYIIKIASLHDDWPEQILGDAHTESLTSLLVSTYNDDLPAIKHLIENRQANLWSRTAALESLHGLFALEIITRQELVNYYADLLNTSIIEDEEFVPWLIDAINSMYPVELYNEATSLISKPSFDHTIITQKNIDDTLDLGMTECLNQNIYSREDLKPVETVINNVKWLYGTYENQDDEDSEEEECQGCNFCKDEKEDEGIMYKRPFIKIGRNELCPCISGKKYKKCCLLIEN